MLESGVAIAMISEKPLCPCDGKPCDGILVLGAPACFTDSFGVVKGKGKACPRLKGKMRFRER